jgi:hypothetical protein
MSAFWHLADIDFDAEHIRLLGVKRTSLTRHPNVR